MSCIDLELLKNQIKIGISDEQLENLKSKFVNKSDLSKYATKAELENLPSGGGGGTDVPTTDIDFSNWEGGDN